MKELSCVVRSLLIDLFICVFLDNRKQELRVQELEKERDALKDELLQLTAKLKAECDMEVKQLQQEKTELIETKEKKVNQLEQLKDTIQVTKSGLRFLTAPEQGKSDDVMILAVSMIN